MRKPSLHRLLAVAVALALLTAAAAYGADAATRSAVPAGPAHDVGRFTMHKRGTGSARDASGQPRRHARKAARSDSHRRRRHRRQAKRHHRRAKRRHRKVKQHHRRAKRHRCRAKRHRCHRRKTKALASPALPASRTAIPSASPHAGTTSQPAGSPPAGAPDPPPPAKQPPPSPACTQTVTSTASATSAVAAAGAEAVVCLTAGAYGPLKLSGAHSGTVTVEPVPGSSASVEGAGVAADSSGLTIHDFSISGGVSLAAGDSRIAIDHNDIDGQGPGGDGEGVETLSVNCSAPNAPTYSGCASTAPDTYITITGNKIHGYGEANTEDAVHLNDWEHVTVTANDIYDLEEHGEHTDALQSVFGGHYMTFAYNFEHDNQAQGFFIKDGDASEVDVTENLFLRNNNEPALYPGGEYNVQVFNTTGFTMTANTVWDGQDDILRAAGAAEPLTATVNHNVEQAFDVLDEGGPAYTLSENYDIFSQAPSGFTKGPQSTVQANPGFVNPAGDNYELATNPDGIGVDWQPSEYVYGPTGN